MFHTHFTRTSLLAVPVAIVLLAGCASLPDTGPRKATIQRTAYGVAHIHAGDYEALAYGMAYAHAQDNVCQTADHLVTIRGERSRFFGPAPQALLGLRPLPNDQIDVFIRAHMDDAALVAAHRSTSADTQALSRGYVAGYNRFLADNAERLPAPCKGQSWVRPMTIEDFHRMNELLAIQLGSGLFAGGVTGARPPQAATAPRSDATPYLHPTGRHAADEALQTVTDHDELSAPMFGSNGWAFGADATTNGRGLLLGNPHFPWFGVNRFWQVHLTIPGRLDVMGVTIGHSPLVVIGFNRDVAWTHTVSTGRRYTLYELTLAPGDPTSYFVDGKPEKMQSKIVRIDVRGADGQITSRDSMLWTTRWGPLFVLPRTGIEWSATTAYAIRDAAAGNSRIADTWLAIDRARSVGEIREAIGSLGIPWVNTIAADRHGDALYADVSVVPDVDAAMLMRCAPGAKPAILFRTAGLVVLNGAKSECEWTRDAGSAVPGLIPAGRMPALVRRDWVQNSNDSFWLSNPSARLTGFSPLIGAVGTQQNFRTRAGVDAITRRLSQGRIGMDDASAMVLDNRNYTAEVVLPDLLAACPDAPGAGAKEACVVLRNWDRRNNLDSRGAHLFREWVNAVTGSTPNIWRVPFNPAEPLTTPAGLDLANADTRTKVWEAMERAVASVRAAGFALDAPLGTVQSRVVRGLRIPIPGGTNAEGVLNVIESDAFGRNGYVPTSGTSYLQVVSFDAAGPVADGILTYGQSSQADSPFAFDQLEPFGRKRLVPLPFRPGEIASMRRGELLELVLP